MERIQRIEAEHGPRGVVPGRKVFVEQGSSGVLISPPRAHGPGGNCAPHIELVREGDVIQAIDVTCTCGQKIRLRCVYDETS